jgi:transcription antitermination factor NusG
VGQAVRVTDGPYAGQTGAVTAVDAAGRVSVFIDDCLEIHSRDLGDGF